MARQDKFFKNIVSCCWQKACCVQAQVAVEYFILLGVTVAIVLVGFQTTFIPESRQKAEVYFNNAAVEIMGNVANAGKARTYKTNYP